MDYVMMRCGETNGSRMWWNYHCCVCFFKYCLKAFLYTIRNYCMVCVCEWTCKNAFDLFFLLLLKGCLDFCFFYLKNVSIDFPSCNYLLFYYRLELWLNIRACGVRDWVCLSEFHKLLRYQLSTIVHCPMIVAPPSLLCVQRECIV